MYKNIDLSAAKTTWKKVRLFSITNLGINTNLEILEYHKCGFAQTKTAIVWKLFWGRLKTENFFDIIEMHLCS